MTDKSKTGNEDQRFTGGAYVLVLSQVLILISQFAYGALTGRAFNAEEFGGFAAALSLQGMMVIATTAGIPSMALRAEVIAISFARRLRIVALLGGIAAGGIYLVIAPAWLNLLNSESGDVQIPLLAAGLVLGSIATLESAFVRRKRGVALDAVTLLASNLVGIASSVVVILTTDALWALSLVAPVQALTHIVATRLVKLPFGDQPGAPTIGAVFRHMTAVSTVGAGSSLSGQMPVWALGAFFGAGAVGSYSRATSLATLPITSIASIIVRLLSPHWRRVPISKGDIEVEVVTLAAALLLIPGALIAALADPLVTLWLGPGWGPAAEFARFLAPAASLGGVALVLASAAEMRGLFAPIRRGQVVSIAALATGIMGAVWLDNMLVVAAAVLAGQFLYVLVMVVLVGRNSRSGWKKITSALAIQIAIAALVGATAHATNYFPALEFLEWSSAIEIATGLSLAFLLMAGTWRWNPAAKILSRRGLLKPLGLFRRRRK